MPSFITLLYKEVNIGQNSMRLKTKAVVLSYFL